MAKSKLTEEQRAAAVKMYQDGSNLYEVASKFGIDHSSVYHLLKQRNIPRRSHRLAFDQNFFNRIDTEDKAYFLGYLYADGYHYDKKYVIKIFLHPKDKIILQRFSDMLSYQGEIKLDRRKSGREYYGLVLNSKIFSEDCNKLGLTRKKSKTLTLPSFDQVPEHLFHHFIRGYFDGDGWISFGKSRAEVGVISSTGFVNSLQTFLREKLGTTGTVKDHPSKGIKILRFSSRRKIVNFMDWIYSSSSIFLHRKRGKYEDYRLSFKNTKNYA